MTPKYSFIMPAYKAKYIGGAIESILNQTYSDFELVIINDQSPENIKGIVEKFKDVRIRYYENEENLGGKDLVAQWNKCLSLARGKYVILSPDDDMYHSEFLQEIDELVEKYPSCNAFRTRCAKIDADGKILEIDGFFPQYIDRQTFFYFYLKNFIFAGIGFWVFNRQVLESQGGYAEMPLAWGSDDITAIKMAENGVAFSPRPLFYFRFSGESISSSVNDANKLKQKLNAMELLYDFCNQLVQQSDNYTILDCNMPYPMSWSLYEMYYGNVCCNIRQTTKLGVLSSINHILSVKHINKKALFLRILLRLIS